MVTLGISMPSEKGRRGKPVRCAQGKLPFDPACPFHSLLTLLAMTATEIAPATRNP